MQIIGVTGQNGFIGYHLTQTLMLRPNEFQIIEFKREYFLEEEKMDFFVKKCDVIVHLAGLNRHTDTQIIFDTNIKLVELLVNSLKRTQSRAHILMTSSTQEGNVTYYGESKQVGRQKLAEWAKDTKAVFTGLIVPNVFGPFCQPFYNSVVATFCHQIAQDQVPIIKNDAKLKLIYVSDLISLIIESIIKKIDDSERLVLPTAEVNVSIIYKLIMYFKKIYQVDGVFPELNNDFELKLFNTYRCYMNLEHQFPKPLKKHIDARGYFVEIARCGLSGQTSFSTTEKGITRGNHFHTRKIERFVVIQGKACIRLRRIGTTKVYEYFLDGESPSYVDIPIWHAHNITNIGCEQLYTVFWINEPYKSDDPDTYTVAV